MSDKTNYAWVLEGNGPLYWDGQTLTPESFVADHMKAIRFLRKEDAETIRRGILKTYEYFAQPVEHGWDE